MTIIQYNLADGNICCKTVSYTHLDVYKRQLKGSNDIALGNVVGSNMFNLLVVIGVSAMICPLHVEKSMIKKDYPLSVLAAALLAPVLSLIHI